jgi:hypothetical protein
MTHLICYILHFTQPSSSEAKQNYPDSTAQRQTLLTQCFVGRGKCPPLSLEVYSSRKIPRSKQFKPISLDRKSQTIASVSLIINLFKEIWDSVVQVSLQRLTMGEIRDKRMKFLERRHTTEKK